MAIAVTDDLIADSLKIHEKLNSQLFTGLMAFVMGLMTMVRMTRNMPRKLTDANFYSESVCSAESVCKPQPPPSSLPGPAISPKEYMIVMQRMAELEEKMVIFNQPAAMPPEKEEMLNTAMSRADALEQELMATKKVIIYS